MSHLVNTIDTIVTVAGKVTPFVYLKLIQSYNAHHDLYLEIYQRELGTLWVAAPQKVFSLAGEEVTITMTQTNNGEETYFEGVIVNVVVEALHLGESKVVIRGKGKTIRMDGKKTMDSYKDDMLQNIVKAATKNSLGDFGIVVNPAHSSLIDYICQYNENDFEFLNRLSYLYGESFWDTGSEIRFGKESILEKAPLKLSYGYHLTSLQFSVKLVPARFNRYGYLVHADVEINANAEERVKCSSSNQREILQKSDSFFSNEGDLPVEVPIQSGSELKKCIEIERSRAAAEMLTFIGTSTTSEVQLGRKIHLIMPDKECAELIDEFLITSVTHEVDYMKRYVNSFSGIASDMIAIPMSPVDPPRTGIQQGTVMSNTDPEGKGRVKVQLQWQKAKHKSTNWIRVQTPDAGSSDKVSNNRGFVCIPEEGDTVVVGFDYGDPNRPFVIGSLFSEVTGAGGGEGNKMKSLTTRSGSALMLDDSQGSMTLMDQGGAVMNFDGSGNAAIEMKKEYLINAGDNITINVGSKEGGVAIIQADKEGNITMKGDKTITMIVGSSKIEMSDSKISISADAISIAGKDIQLNGKGAWQGGDIKIN